MSLGGLRVQAEKLRAARRVSVQTAEESTELVREAWREAALIMIDVQDLASWRVACAPDSPNHNMESGVVASAVEPTRRGAEAMRLVRGIVRCANFALSQGEEHYDHYAAKAIGQATQLVNLLTEPADRSAMAQRIATAIGQALEHARSTIVTIEL
jgi:hypothetical protein